MPSVTKNKYSTRIGDKPLKNDFKLVSAFLFSAILGSLNYGPISDERHYFRHGVAYLFRVQFHGTYKLVIVVFSVTYNNFYINLECHRQKRYQINGSSQKVTFRELKHTHYVERAKGKNGCLVIFAKVYL